MNGSLEVATSGERERFDEAWYPGEALRTTTLAERDGKTMLTLTIRYESRAARDSGQGLELGSQRLDRILASPRASGAKPARRKERGGP